MAILELIGPPGVGKTTFLHRLLSTRSSRTWRSVEEMLRTGLIAGPDPYRLTYVDDLLLNLKIENVVADYRAAVDRYALCFFFQQNLLLDIALRPHWAQSPVVNDDGICHNFCTELSSVAQRSASEFKNLMRNRALIVLDSHESTVLQNVRRRQTQGIYRPGVNTATDAEILARTRKLKDAISAFCCHARDAGAPVLELNLAGRANERRRLRWTS